jgi:hypothetical protein
MGFRDQAKALRNELVKTQEQSFKNKDDRSGAFGSIFVKEKLPENVNIFKCKEGEHVIDVVPWITGEGHPTLPPGKLSYIVDFWAHMNIGPMNDVIPCNQYMYRKPCAICEYINKQRLPKDEYTKLKAKRRVVYLVWSHDTIEEERKGLQIFEVSHYFMEANLVVIAQNPKGGGSIVFADPDAGKTIVFSRKGSGASDTKFIGHRFVDREAPIPDHILDQTFPVEACMKLVADYDETKELFYKGLSSPSSSEQSNPSGQDNGSMNDPGQDGSTCPGNGQFGVDVNKLAECKGCVIWDNCYETSQASASVRGRRRY